MSYTANIPEPVSRGEGMIEMGVLFEAAIVGESVVMLTAT